MSTGPVLSRVPNKQGSHDCAVPGPSNGVKCLDNGDRNKLPLGTVEKVHVLPGN